MRKTLLFLTLFCLYGGIAHAQWYTAHSEMTGLILCLNVKDSTLFSPLQSADPLPVTRWEARNDTLRVECKSLDFRMTLVRNGKEMEGTWRQQLLRERIVFRQSDTIFQLRRPQNPEAPYGFDADTIVADYIDSHGDEIHLEGTLTYPKGGEGRHRYPCLVLVSGSGQQNRDEELLQHHPFLVIADYLAKRGIAVLRYDDRGVGSSRGPLEHADTRLFSEDAEAMFRAVRSHAVVDTLRLGMGGHSEGGAIAPMVAARNRDVKFVVMLAGQGCTGREVLLQQNEALYRGKGVSEALLSIRLACMDELMRLPADVSVGDMQEIIGRHTQGLTKQQKDSISLKNSDAYALHTSLVNSWMQFFVHLSAADYLPKVKSPLLALNGDKDCQVLAEPNLKQIVALCPHADCRLLPGLNHLFQHCESGLPDEYMLIEETFAPEALQAIADFILSL